MKVNELVLTTPQHANYGDFAISTIPFRCSLIADCRRS